MATRRVPAEERLLLLGVESITLALPLRARRHSSSTVEMSPVSESLAFGAASALSEELGFSGARELGFSTLDISALEELGPSPRRPRVLDSASPELGIDITALELLGLPPPGAVALELLGSSPLERGKNITELEGPGSRERGIDVEEEELAPWPGIAEEALGPPRIDVGKTSPNLAADAMVEALALDAIDLELLGAAVAAGFAARSS
ncbi:hypothetical protein SELMODRAFT_416920 [Selaginella moellendorffii]|uniref:Uncharacterized protein n=1 Tax=Selaginella moellendorffii TaxID=88036 RepID=D8S0T7_SELML|nr:hypothetical protein SELMODRAFT_416920 [Selaginella moellendorffii]